MVGIDLCSMTSTKGGIRINDSIIGQSFYLQFVWASQEGTRVVLQSCVASNSVLEKLTKHKASTKQVWSQLPRYQRQACKRSWEWNEFVLTSEKDIVTPIFCSLHLYIILNYVQRYSVIPSVLGNVTELDHSWMVQLDAAAIWPRQWRSFATTQEPIMLIRNMLRAATKGRFVCVHNPISKLHIVFRRERKQLQKLEPCEKHFSCPLKICCQYFNK